MSIPNLPVNFKDDILASTNTKRKYQLIYNTDGTVSLEDVTSYSQKGSSFGAAQVNQTNTAINNIYSQRMLDLDDVALVTEPGFFVDALAVKELNSKLPIIDYGSVIVTAQPKAISRTSVKFSKDFTKAPTVVCEIETNWADTNQCSIGRASITTSGCDLLVYNGATASNTLGIMWIAVGE